MLLPISVDPSKVYPVLQDKNVCAECDKDEPLLDLRKWYQCMNTTLWVSF